MKKNDMLNESTIRRFMKLATIDGLSDKFVTDTLQEAEEEGGHLQRLVLPEPGLRHQRLRQEGQVLQVRRTETW